MMKGFFKFGSLIIGLVIERSKKIVEVIKSK